MTFQPLPPAYAPIPPKPPKRTAKIWASIGAAVGCLAVGALMGGGVAAASIEPVEVPVEVIREVEKPADISACVDALYTSAELLDIYGDAVGAQTKNIDAAAKRDVAAMTVNNDKLASLLEERDAAQVRWEREAASCMDLQ